MKTRAAERLEGKWLSAAIERGSKEGQKVIFIFLSIPTSAISQWSFLNLSGLESRGPLRRVPPSSSPTEWS